LGDLVFHRDNTWFFVEIESNEIKSILCLYMYGERGGKLMNNKLSCGLFAQRAGVEDIKSKGLKKNHRTNRTKVPSLLWCVRLSFSLFDDLSHQVLI